MSKSVTLKRTVTIKAIVTEDFKKYLTYELETSIKDLQKKMSDIEVQAKGLIDSLGKDSSPEQSKMISQQLQVEKQQQESTVADLKKRIEDAKNLKLDSEFIQGTIDGFTTIKAGDNLYQKLGALEIVVKDGVVQEIKGEQEG